MITKYRRKNKMKRLTLDVPNLISATQVVKNAECMRAQLPDQRWVPARGIPFWGLCLGRRIKLAWMVFTGKADALTWEA